LGIKQVTIDLITKGGMEQMMEIVDLARQGIMDTDDVEVKDWLSIRKLEALKIDPDTAEVTWWYVQMADPYGVDCGLPEECQCVGRQYFVRRPGSDICVWIGDLPNETRRRLREKHRL
jgi:hypothetical protein